MAHQKHLLNPHFVKHPHQVPHDVQGGVLVGGRRRVGVAVAAEVRGDGSIPGGWEEINLVAPWVPELREAVQEENWRPGSGDGDVQFNAVGFNGDVLDGVHWVGCGVGCGLGGRFI